jgi:hypothetical protein
LTGAELINTVTEAAMRRNRVLAAIVVGAAGALCTTPALAQRNIRVEGQSVRLMRGSITGTVSDDRGGPLPGAVISALGATMAVTVSDATGFFAIDALPTGEYVLQAHLSGFAGSPRERVQVGAVSPSFHRFQLRRLALAAVGTTGSVPPVAARPIMAGGFGLPSTTLSDQPDPADETATAEHPHTETAWRLRHIKRSVLKDSSSSIVDFADTEFEPPASSPVWRAVDSAASFATTLFGELPFSGEVNVLTTSAFAPGDLLSGNMLPRGVAYLSIGAPTTAGDWSARAAMSEGDLSSWIVAGSFASRPGSTHTYNLGLSYSTQEYTGGNPAALAAFTDTSRNVGELYAFDKWSVSRRVTFEYGGRYAHYDYLESRNLLSPRVAMTFEPLKDTRITTSVSQRMVAPGAEEFLATGTPGPWLPPERTFAPLDGIADHDVLRVERARAIGIGVEHEFKGMSIIGIQRFFQSVDDQLVTLFGLSLPDGPGHYYVASAGGLEADGWAFRVSSAGHRRLRGSVDYSITHARWTSRGDASTIARLAPSAIRSEAEDLHDVTTSVETAIPETATRVFVLYKMNSGYARSSAAARTPALDGRFDVQVNQALPFAFAGTRWEILLGVRNLFRDPTDPGSVYDELLVVRPPKRVVGGFLVKF